METMTPADLDPRRQALLLYFQGYRVARIAEMLGEKVATVHSWKKRDKWGEYGPLDQMQLTTAARYCQLIMKEHKEGKDFKEIDLLARQSERHARIGKFHNGGNEADLNPNVQNRNRGPRRTPEKNLFTDEQIEKLEEIFRNGMFEYQRHWWEAGIKHRIRNVLKSRQIGATYYFAREALMDALMTGRNQNLLMCEFIDDLASVFPLADLQACMVDSWEVWEDFQPLALRPFGWREVWIGYDPAKGTQNGDSAGCVVIAPPTVPGGKFRILERHQWRGMDFRAQAEAIRKLTQQYNVTYIGIDSTGVGHGVYENVKGFFPAVREFVYNPNVKNALVLKAYDIISHRRLEFDAGHTDIAQSFMAIRRATTASGNRPTYEASRSEEASHADLAWATMHALFNEPLQGEAANTSNIVEIF
ncbi:TPA: terminase family protein [Klebsiella pneumoniae]|nr:terminase family protein [Klebsiella pneumoniae]